MTLISARPALEFRFVAMDQVDSVDMANLLVLGSRG